MLEIRLLELNATVDFFILRERVLLPNMAMIMHTRDVHKPCMRPFVISVTSLKNGAKQRAKHGCSGVE